MRLRDYLFGLGMSGVLTGGGDGGLATLPAGLDYTGGAVWSLNRLFPGYSGSTVVLIRASDSDEEEFGFDATGLFKAADVVSWLGASTAKFTQVFDQTGNGNHAVQTTDAARPTYELSYADGMPVWMHGNLNGNYSRDFDLPAGVAQNPQSFASYTVYKCRNGYPTHPYNMVLPAVGIGAVPNGTTLVTDGAAALYSNAAGLNVMGNTNYGAKVFGPLPLDTVPEALGIVSTTSGIHALAGSRHDAFSATAVSRHPNQVPAGGKLGKRYTGGLVGEGEVRALVVMPETTVAVARTIIDALEANNSLRATQTKMLWWVGDSQSTTYPIVASMPERWKSPGHRLAQSQSTYHVRVFAQIGWRIDQLNASATTSSGGSNMDAWATEMGAGNSACLLWAGLNDFNQGASLATVQGRASDWVTARKLAGFGPQWVATLIPVGSYVSPDSLRTDYNSWLLSGGSGADEVVDFAGLGNWSGKMQPDGVHLNEAGNIEVARVMQEFLAAL